MHVISKNVNVKMKIYDDKLTKALKKTIAAGNGFAGGLGTPIPVR